MCLENNYFYTKHQLYFFYYHRLFPKKEWLMPKKKCTVVLNKSYYLKNTGMVSIAAAYTMCSIKKSRIERKDCLELEDDLLETEPLLFFHISLSFLLLLNRMQTSFPFSPHAWCPIFPLLLYWYSTHYTCECVCSICSIKM